MNSANTKKLMEARKALEEILCAEQERLDNGSENFVDSDAGQECQGNVDSLQNALDSIDEVAE